MPSYAEFYAELKKLNLETKFWPEGQKKAFTYVMFWQRKH